MNTKEFGQMKRADFEHYFWTCVDSPDVSAEEIEDLITELNKRNKILYAAEYICYTHSAYHVDEMIDAVIKYGDFTHATACVKEAYQNNYAPDRFEELFDLFVGGPSFVTKFDWLMQFDYSDNAKIKIRMLEHDMVAAFYRYVADPMRAGLYADIRNKGDFEERFYADVPKEMQLGIMV